MCEQPNRKRSTDEVLQSTLDIHGDVGCFSGTRVEGSQLLVYVRDGYTIDDLLRDLPRVNQNHAERGIERIDNG